MFIWYNLSFLNFTVIIQYFLSEKIIFVKKNEKFYPIRIIIIYKIVKTQYNT
jgi:hypothetical protein